jgi:hypothetical protein
MYVNDTRKSQLMMRYRVLFQFTTISAVVGGIYWRAYQSTTRPEGAFRGAAGGQPGRQHRCHLAAVDEGFV